ncbi:hypothetical protein U9M48_019288 [Paspalum notatum var. saurae]|uniref:Uncharacterized protein n=1 Tax=Paspalum notatum var. saurae TaxID=547442 RepID=A0AAQ3TDM1_PASNO
MVCHVASYAAAGSHDHMGGAPYSFPGPLYPEESYGAEAMRGNRTVMQYVQSFIHLSQYSPGDVADDPRRVARLLSGFDSTLMTHLGRHC